MVLTEEEVQSATMSRDQRIKKNWNGRQKSNNLSLVEQACCDREIQRYLNHKETYAYKCNCYIIHQPSRFLRMEATSDHGWGRYGPTNPVLANIILNSPIKHLVQPTNVAQAAAAAGAVAQCGGIEYEEEDNGYVELTDKDFEELLEFDNSPSRWFDDDEESDAMKQRRYDRIMEELGLFDYESSDWESEEEDS